VPVIGFGGSYGGMLGTWFRLKYPHLMDGVIAASAPVLHFMNDPDHPVDSEAFQRIVTFDMSSAAGASENCVANARKAKLAGFRLSATPEGRQMIATAFKLCNPDAFQTPEASRELPDMLIGVFGSLAMGNYPYPSSYITEGGAPFPTYPVRAACEHLAPDFGDDDEAVLAALRDAAGVFLNATGELQCYFPTPNDTVSKPSKTDVNLWSYIECSELYMPFSSDGVHDVASPTTQNVTRDAEECFEMWGVRMRPNWAVTQYGGLKAIRASSNIVFSNGNFDPWSGTGVLETQSETVVALPIEGGAHHVDLFFQHPMDPPSLTQAREVEKQHMRKWIKEFYDHKASLAADKKM
jgi:lysosomal Pro-X carboxypeptidase